ncbi:hypothetical protein LCGC14_1672840 [marine sediment metagenome]|uniref:Uncharacterized protein n=1 Tax=marine sediment metagenome TaxID=412755 RepID=A0A0F9KQM5_9ZZZZ
MVIKEDDLVYEEIPGWPHPVGVIHIAGESEKEVREAAARLGVTPQQFIMSALQEAVDYAKEGKGENR